MDNHKCRRNLKNIRNEYKKCTFLEWKLVKELIYDIKILPKYLIFKKITKNVNFAIFF